MKSTRMEMQIVFYEEMLAFEEMKCKSHKALTVGECIDPKYPCCNCIIGGKIRYLQDKLADLKGRIIKDGRV